MNTNDALIGHSGFVGSTLLRQRSFSHCYRSTTMETIRGESFSTVVCAAAPAAMWVANQKPEEDLAGIQSLIAHLDTITCESFVLISTVAVFPDSVGVDESSPVPLSNTTPYGHHRRLLEAFVERKFKNHLILRLPGLVGPGLRKNAIFDLLNNHQLHAVDSRGSYQFYPMVNLWRDIVQAQNIPNLRLLHLSVAPVTVAEVAEECFGRPFTNHVNDRFATFDMRSQCAQVMGGQDGYVYSRRESMQAIRAYAQSEPTFVHNAVNAT